MMFRYVYFILAVSLSVSPVHAALTAVFVDVTHPLPDPLPGFVTQDLIVTTTADWGTAQILATLDTGTIYQDPDGSDFAPNPLLFPTFPTLKFDSYLDGNGQPPGIAGAAVELGGDVQAFSQSHIDITWFNTATNDIGTVGLGRFTLSDDATGTWSMLITSAGGSVSFQGLINNGLFDLRPTGGGPPIPGDLNADFFVGVDDLNIVLSNWNQQVLQVPIETFGDLDGDLFVGINDLNIVLLNWNQNVVIPGDLTFGDLDGDGFIGVGDLNIVLLNWNVNVPNADPLADPTGDGFVGVDDLNLVLANWNSGTPPSLGALIPEPGTVGMFVLLGTLGVLNRKRCRTV